MDELSLNFNLESPDATATANLLQANDNQSGIEFLRQEIERGMENLLAIASMFSSNVPDKPKFEINAVGASSLTPEQKETLDKLVDGGFISKKQYVEIINKTLPFDIKFEEQTQDEPQGKEKDQEDGEQPPESDDNAPNDDELDNGTE